MRILFLLALSFYSFAAPTDFSECKGKEANYYVAKITKGGSAAGWPVSYTHLTLPTTMWV